MTQINIPDHLLGVPTNLFGGGLFGAIFTFIFSRKRQAAETHKIEAEGDAAFGAFLNEKLKTFLEHQEKLIESQAKRIEEQSQNISALRGEVNRLSTENMVLTEEIHTLSGRVDKLQKDLARKNSYDTLAG